MSHSPQRLALRSALRFLNMAASWASDSYWRTYCTTVAFDVEEPTFSSKRYSRNPEISLHLRTDWMTAVHLRGFDRLPTSPGAGIFGDRLMILHVDGAHFVQREVLVAPAIWTRGRKSAKGFIAWRRDEEYACKITSWAVSRTEAAALDDLTKWHVPPSLPRGDSEVMATLEF